jgi:hypothetical protein
VGNCCINKFLGIDAGNKIFFSIKKLREDITSSISAEVIEYFYRKRGMTEFDYKFYKSIFRKRKLSPKQLEIKKNINSKFLSFTSYETNSHFNKINKVLKWAEGNTTFNTDFALSLKKSCELRGRLTENQLAALDNIIKKFNI